ncbi:MAG: lamin tail domain-containing protein [Verrucomicrobiota bacterium]
MWLLQVLLSPASEVVINEFMARNDSTLLDGFGEYSDWIELHNRSNTVVDLAGWYLTDDTNNLMKWMFPSTNIAADGYLVLFASNRDTNFMGELHLNFRLSGGGEYLALIEPDGTTVAYEYAPAYPDQEDDFSYGIGAFATNAVFVPEFNPARALVPTGDIGTNWLARTGFDDSTWTAGNAGVGYERNTGYETLIGIDVEGPMFNTNGSVYVRMPFVVNTPTSEVVELSLKMKYDDGFIAYLNGVPVASNNAPPAPQWNSNAAGPNPDAQAVLFETFSIANPTSILVQGTNMLAIHGLNNGIGGTDMLVLLSQLRFGWPLQYTPICYAHLCKAGLPP